MRKVWTGNKVEEKKKHVLHVTSAAKNRVRAELMQYRKRTVIMDYFMSDVKKKSWNKNWRDALVIEHTCSKV